MTLRHLRTQTKLGNMLLVARDDALIGAYFDNQRYLPENAAFGEQVLGKEDQLLHVSAAQMNEYLEGTRKHFALPLAPEGDEFSQRVWQILLTIPYGETTSYGAIARELGNAAFAQRVGQSVGHNPLSVIVPCHRVMGSDGSLTGYAGGLDRKRALLTLEEPAAAEANRLF
ncbi:methylated-DNA--[protein]-cysteine S-methyltransferase [Leucobacter sp. UT-8R-CII-1-4]|uniref:methylated-DNA--[protein]-cysteine S-methyltransferase n=1 Tax=Leucobacter sp. UT-8R-CII-1-4 TaxID=3040075 RepID=UPI0024A8AC20|nr:methylated-DNA--[protein]-cysteine S-methyltransferase [Leucobacter sp. UT-8R-CII-1-4]MDI6023226.1 methylated-DNA--[protein]-cysteine S-methyltransferase [Leucobacter sp. UT-8R-CII-1-4]